jgi:hypothetical protein
MSSPIEFALTQKELDEVLALLASVEEKLPGMVNLSTAERLAGMNIADGNMPFIRKAVDYSEKRPKITPSFVDAEQFRAMLNSFLHLQELLNETEEFREKLEDTQMAIGQMLSQWALAFYKAAQIAARNNVPGIDTIVTKLGKRFEKNGTISNNEVDQNLENPEGGEEEA